MKNRTITLWALLLMLVLTFGDLACQYPFLPERLASHFGPSGEANGWMSKSAFALFIMGLCVFNALALVRLSLRFRSLPNDKINLPNKEYWLAPENRESTLALLGEYMLWFAVVMQALLAGVFHLVYRANLTTKPQLGSTVWFYLAAFLAFTFCWVVSMTLRFKRVPR